MKLNPGYKLRSWLIAMARPGAYCPDLQYTLQTLDKLFKYA